jgi:hypothetical protein
MYRRKRTLDTTQSEDASESIYATTQHRSEATEPKVFKRHKNSDEKSNVNETSMQHVNSAQHTSETDSIVMQDVDTAAFDRNKGREKQIMSSYQSAIGSERPIGATFDSERTDTILRRDKLYHQNGTCSVCDRQVSQPVVYESRAMCLNCFRIHMGWMPKCGVKAAIEDEFLTQLRVHCKGDTYRTFVLNKCLFEPRSRFPNEDIIMCAIRQSSWWTLYEAFTLLQCMLDCRIGLHHDDNIRQDELVIISSDVPSYQKDVLDDKWCNALLPKVLMEREGPIHGLLPSRYRFKVDQFDSHDGVLVWNTLKKRQQTNLTMSPLQYALVLSGMYRVG